MEMNIETGSTPEIDEDDRGRLFATARIATFNDPKFRQLMDLRSRLAAADRGKPSLDAVMWWLFLGDPALYTEAVVSALDIDASGQFDLPDRSWEVTSRSGRTSTVRASFGPVPAVSTSIDEADAMIRRWGGDWAKKDVGVSVSLFGGCGGVVKTTRGALALDICRGMAAAVEMWISWGNTVTQVSHDLRSGRSTPPAASAASARGLEGRTKRRRNARLRAN